MLKKISLILLVCMIALFLFSCSEKAGEPVYTGDGGDIVIIKVKGYDEAIRVQLCPEDAPITVANFKNNVEAGVYDNTIFHRVIKNFMIQGGDPSTAGNERTETIKGEFSANGVNNTLKHERGVLSMARGNDYNSASSQFFICHTTEGCAHLDGVYAAFGYVLSGMDTVDAIAGVTTNFNDRPMVDIVIESITFEK